MNPEPIDEHRVSLLFAKSDAAEQAQARTAQAWRSFKAREKRQKRIFFAVMLPLLALSVAVSVHFTRKLLKAQPSPDRLPTPQKQPDAVLGRFPAHGGGAGAQATFDAEGRMVRVSL